jgi:hypothetical protein
MVDGPVRRVFVGCAEGELVQVGLADEDGASPAQPQAVTHVLVGLQVGASEDLARLWNNTVAEPQFADTTTADTTTRRTQRDTTRTTNGTVTQ